MKRIVDTGSVVHYAHPANKSLALCGRNAYEDAGDLFGNHVMESWKETRERVDCPFCVRTLCAIRNEPYNTIVSETAPETLVRGCYDAVKED